MATFWRISRFAFFVRFYCEIGKLPSNLTAKRSRLSPFFSYFSFSMFFFYHEFFLKKSDDGNIYPWTSLSKTNFSGDICFSLWKTYNVLHWICSQVKFEYLLGLKRFLNWILSFVHTLEKTNCVFSYFSSKTQNVYFAPVLFFDY